MERSPTKIDPDVMWSLERLGDQQEIDVLVYPTRFGGEFERFLQTRKHQGALDYNILQLANCVVVKASKQAILEIAARDDVAKISANPRFMAH